MRREADSDLEFELRRLAIRHAQTLANFPWPLARDRYLELVFALLTRVTTIPEAAVRQVVEDLDALDLLDVDTLAVAREDPADPDPAATTARRIHGVLVERGWSDEDARRGVRVGCQLARSLSDRHAGDVQHYVRSYADRMLDESMSNFNVDALSEAELRAGLAYWLQDVFNMPVHLNSANTEAFCRKVNATDEQVIAAAERVGIDVAVLDDILEVDAASAARGSTGELQEAVR